MQKQLFLLQGNISFLYLPAVCVGRRFLQTIPKRQCCTPTTPKKMEYTAPRAKLAEWWCKTAPDPREDFGCNSQGQG